MENTAKARAVPALNVKALCSLAAGDVGTAKSDKGKKSLERRDSILRGFLKNLSGDLGADGRVSNVSIEKRVKALLYDLAAISQSDMP